MVEPNQEEINKIRNLLHEGIVEEALEFVNTLEKRGDITDFEKVECLILKCEIYNEMGLFDDWFELSKLILQEGERLEKPDFMAYAYFSRLWALYLGEKLAPTIKSGKDLVSQLEELTKYASTTEIDKIKGLITPQKAYNYYSEGDLDSALELFEESIKKPSIWTSHKIPLHFLRIGDIYLTKGELNYALEYYEKGLSLFKGDSYNTKINTAMTFGQIGDLYFQQNKPEISLEYYKKSLKIYNEVNFIVLIGAVFDGLIKISLAQGKPEQAKKYLKLFKQANEQNELPSNQLWYQLSNTRLLKFGNRLHDWVEAGQILKQLIEDLSYDYTGPLSPKNTAIIELCDLLLEELQITSNADILDEIQFYINRLRESSKQQNSYSLLSETTLLNAKLELINLELEKAKKSFNQAQAFAEDHSLTLLAQKISSEYDNFLEQSDLWEEFKRKRIPFSDRLKLASINSIMDRLKGNRTIEPPELVDEHSMLILIMSEGGAPLFSYPFTDEWKFDDELFGGFLTAFNSISDEIFSEGLDRVKFGNYTVLMEPIENFSICYLFKGQAYPAKQKLAIFIEKLQNDTAIWSTLTNFNKTSQVADLNDIPMIEKLLKNIFLYKK